MEKKMKNVLVIIVTIAAFALLAVGMTMADDMPIRSTGIMLFSLAWLSLVGYANI